MENNLELNCDCPECNSKLKINFSGDPKKGFDIKNVGISKKGIKKEPEPEPEPGNKSFLENWYEGDK